MSLPKKMSLPETWVDKIFLKLTLLYGRDFVGRWEGLSIADVKTDWAHELAGFEKWPEAIAYALANLPAGKPPTVLEFLGLARKAPRKTALKLPAPADQSRVAEELRKLAPVRAGVHQTVDHKAWAHRILEREQIALKTGQGLQAVTVRSMARQALGMEGA